MEEKILLSLIVAPAVEDTLVDWLLARRENIGFTSFPVYGHGASEQAMTQAEKVTGRKKQILFQTYLNRQQSKVIVDALITDFKGSGMHYWTVPLIEGGHIC
jgi:hypothetical protein